MGAVQQLFKDGMLLVVLLSLPSLVVAVVVGVLVSVVQTMFSVQDQSLPFAIKLLSVGLALLATGRWCATEVVQLMEQCFLTVSLMSARS